MDKVGILCEKDRAMMYDFSRLSLGRLGKDHMLLTSLPFFTSYYDANVRKEIEKDRLIIKKAAGAFEAGKAASELDWKAIFEETKTVDRAFINSLLIPSFSIIVRYGDIADIRIRRIQRITNIVYDLLTTWQDSVSFADNVRSAYTGNGFRDIIMDILHLYNQETRLLSHSIKLLPPLNSAMRSFSETLFQTMEEVTKDLADTYTSKLFASTRQAGDNKVYV